MTIKEVIEQAKKLYNKDITEEQAQKWLDAHPNGQLTDEELDNVSGGLVLLGLGEEDEREKERKIKRNSGIR